MKKYLIKLADHLDKKGLHKEANYVDWILKNAELDPVGEEDEDVNNDGVEDDSDKYILNKRKTISKAIKERE